MKESIVGEQINCKENKLYNFRCSLITGLAVSEDGKSIECFGMEAIFSNNGEDIQYVIEDMTLERESLLEFMEKLRRNHISIEHFMDLVEDFIEQQAMVEVPAVCN